ncbi:MAG: hypothetical protein M3N49_00145 [Candidatus Eremiobacteraeota bacterium]|nr:hypothetical protein [Candidatus Eremiobacteraeota bacterium]
MALLTQLIPLNELTRLSEAELEHIWQALGVEIHKSPEIMNHLHASMQKILPTLKQGSAKT